MIRLPQHISRTFIQEHPQWIFIYSADVAGKCFFGQCNAAAGESNAWPVYVMWKSCRSSGFFTDMQFLEIKELNDEAIRLAETHAGYMPILPIPNIGCGFSRMKEFAPKSWEYLHEQLRRIAYKEIEIIYGT